MYSSTKTYGHDIGLSSAFRQWRAKSHCKLIHGYALSIHLVFSASELDENNWVVDFGALKTFRTWLEDTFDHKLLVAEDDPELDTFKLLQDKGLADIVLVPNCGCEAFSSLVYSAANAWLEENGYIPRVKLISVEVREHGANSAVYEGG